MSDCVWMRVSKDKYELPEIIANSAAELARKCGVTKGVVFRLAKKKHSKYVKVVLDENED